MAIHYAYRYGTRKGVRTGAAVRRVLEALRTRDQQPGFLHLAMMGFQDDPWARVRDEVPSLAPPPGRQAVILNGLPLDDGGWDDLVRIADGVPRRYRVMMGAFTFGNVALLDLSSEPVPPPPDGTLPTPAGLAHPMVSVSPIWTPQATRPAISALVRLDPPPPQETALPALPEATASFLSELGPLDETLLVAPGAGGSRGAALLDKADLERAWEGVQFPHDLPDEVVQAIPHPPKKAPLTKALKAVGFSVRKGRGAAGVYRYQKETPAHNAVAIEVDVGTWSRMVTARAAFVGPGGIQPMVLPLRSRATPLQYRIGDEAHWQRVCENLAAAAGWLVDRIVPLLDAQAGSAPRWLTAEVPRW
jgi:hypothetical protein